MSMQVLVLMVPVFFGFMGFAIDLGRLYMARNELKTAANAMALAAAQRLNGTESAIEAATLYARIPIDATNGPANKYDFSFLAPCPSSGLIITGDKDEIVTESSVRQLAQKISKQKDIRIDYTVVPGVDHFFSGQLDVLVRHVDAYLKKIA